MTAVKELIKLLGKSLLHFVSVVCFYSTCILIKFVKNPFFWYTFLIQWSTKKILNLTLEYNIKMGDVVCLFMRQSSTKNRQILKTSTGHVTAFINHQDPYSNTLFTSIMYLYLVSSVRKNSKEKRKN